MRTGSTLSAERSAGSLLFPVAPAVLGAVFVLAREVSYGPCSSWDSAEYIAAARNLAAGEGFVRVTGPFTAWSPLYPLLLLAAGALLRLDPLDVAGPLNAAVFGLTVFVFGRYLRRRLDSRFAAAWACAALSLSVPLADAASWNLSEPPFILLTTLALIETDKFLTAGKRRSPAAAAAWSALAALTRYIGALVPVFAGLALLLRQGAPPQRRAREAAAFLSAACLPAALWILRNYLFFGTFTGYGDGTLRFNTEQPRPLLRVLRQAFSYLLEWTHLDLAWGAAAAGAIAAVAFASRRRGPRADAARSASWIWGGFALTYFVLLIALISVGFAPSLHTESHVRYLFPIWIPLLAAAAFALDRFLSRGRERKFGGGLPAAAVMAALCLWTAGQAAANARRICQINVSELPVSGCYNEPPLADSEMLRYIEALPSAGPLNGPLSGVVYSNEPIALSLYNRARALYRHLPKEPPYPPPVPTRPDAGQKRAAARLADAPHGAWVVWLESEYRDNRAGYGAAWLSTLPNLEPAAQTADGAVFKVNAFKVNAPKVNTDAPLRPNPYRAALRAAVGAAPPPVAGRRVTGRGSDRASRGGHGSRVAGGFDISWRGKELVYIKQECSEQDARTRFFLHVWPQDEAVLAAARKPQGMDNLDFHFRKYGVVLDGACVAVRPLPDYAAARIRTGQFTPERGALWQTELTPPAADNE